MQFAKWQGLGNDYLIVEAAALPRPLRPSDATLLCDRHYGVGGDGILIHEAPGAAAAATATRPATSPSTSATLSADNAVARMRILNPDGSEPEMCGNGIRMFARYLEKQGVVAPGDEFVVDTLAGPIRPRILPDGRVRVGMGEARFISDSIAAAPDTTEVVRHELEALGLKFSFTFVDVGNPHCVIVAEDLGDLPLAEFGPVIERLPLFPNRVNVEFIRLEPNGSVTMRVWERGVGETQACGTGATAVGAAAVRLGLTQSPVVVHLLGGDLEIEAAPDWQMVMTGPAEEVFVGELSPELLKNLGWPVATGPAGPMGA